MAQMEPERSDLATPFVRITFCSSEFRAGTLRLCYLDLGTSTIKESLLTGVQQLGTLRSSSACICAFCPLDHMRKNPYPYLKIRQSCNVQKADIAISTLRQEEKSPRPSRRPLWASIRGCHQNAPRSRARSKFPSRRHPCFSGPDRHARSAAQFGTPVRQ